MRTSHAEEQGAAHRHARICVVRHGYFPDDPRVRRAVGALLEEGYAVDVVCLRNEGEPALDTWRSATVHRLPIRHHRRGLARYLWEYSSFLALAMLRVGRLHLRRRYDLVQVHTLPDPLVFAALVPKLMSAVVVLDMHELMPEFARARFRFRGASLLVRLTAVLERLAASFADAVIGVSPAQAEIIEPRIGKRCHVVPNVPDASFVRHAGSQPHEDPPVPALVTHGSILEGYGIQLLVDALPRVLAQQPVRAYVVGGGEYLDELKRRADAIGVTEHIEFTGRVPFADVPRYITGASAGIVTLLQDGYMELGVPNKLFEYIALGVPVIAPDLPGIRSYFERNDLVLFRAGDSADLADKIVELLRSTEIRDRVVQRSRAVYEGLRWEKSSRDYLQLIDSLIAGRR